MRERATLVHFVQRDYSNDDESGSSFMFNISVSDAYDVIARKQIMVLLARELIRKMFPNENVPLCR